MKAIKCLVFAIFVFGCSKADGEMTTTIITTTSNETNLNIQSNSFFVTSPLFSNATIDTRDTNVSDFTTVKPANVTDLPTTDVNSSTSATSETTTIKISDTSIAQSVSTPITATSTTITTLNVSTTTAATISTTPLQNITTAPPEAVTPKPYQRANAWGSFLIIFGITVIVILIGFAVYYKKKPTRWVRSEFSPLLSELETDA